MLDPAPSQSEVRAAFDWVLDRALDSQQVADALQGSGGSLNREQLRTRALEARTAIVAAADIEYREYLDARARATRRGGRPDPGDSDTADGRESGGLLPTLAVLVPTLSAVSATVFLLTGFGLRAFDDRPYVGGGLITAGLIAAAVTVGAAIGDGVWLLRAAARNRPAEDGASAAPGPEVSTAWNEWQLALLERGILPFLLGRIEAGRTGRPGGRPVR
ncbi:hypothetical protein AAW14_29630 [Streptomyces hygroscopicus]|uniref:hypothetical protein n=1 Tax=Streptomyces hygroscopicus TaxID=1912 RepID=UPI00223EDB91|nr:hypothetical protein [Streptomyces hygroscopicus]MCW7946048.1 hypothetical protein [Streptomyces hygroscopicus]